MYVRVERLITVIFLLLVIGGWHHNPLNAEDVPPLCWDHATVQNEMAEETFEEFIESVGESSGIYFAMQPSSPGVVPIGSATYLTPVDVDTALEITLNVYWPQPDEMTLRAILLLNERPLIQSTPGQDEQTTYRDLTLASRTVQTFQFEIPPLTEGIHDLIFLGIPNANTLPTPFGDYTSYKPRLTLVAGQPTNVELPYENLPAAAPTPDISLQLSLSDRPLVWNYPESYLTLEAGETLAFNILAGRAATMSPNSSEEGEDTGSHFALITLLDYQPIAVNGEEPVVYAEVTSDGYALIPVAVTPDLPPGQYDVLAVRINNPRVPMCVMRGPQGMVFDANVDTHRVSVKIE